MKGNNNKPVVKQVTVYLPEDKLQKISEIASSQRMPLTRWIENAIDTKIKRSKRST